MNKRLTSLILAVVMLLSLTVTAVPTFATGTDNGLSLSKEKASAGETFELYLKIPPITAGKSAANEFKIDYDKAVVKLTEFNPGCPSGASIGAYSTPDEANAAGQVGVNYNTAGGENLADWSEGLTYTFKFQVLDSAAVGNTKFEITTYTIVGYEEDGYTEIDYIPAGVVKEAILNITAAPKPATGISLNKSTLELTVGESETLVATVEPADTTDTVTWESDNTAVATVDTNGKVTAVATGTATITAKAGSQSATCVVTVTNAPCAHTNKSTVPAKDSTCTVKGWDEYKRCDNCGQLFDTSDEKIDEVPFRSLADHTGGTATCTAKAVCSVCHQPYGNYAAHSYTAETKKAEALKTAGNCRDKAVYYYSCSVCGNVEHNDAHTFEGDKDTNTHVGGTTTVNAMEPDHENQRDGYTGDTQCLGCGEIIATGTTIPAGAHTPSSTWNSDGTYHWKECAVQGCDVVIADSKAEHSPTWKYNSTSHWHVCAVCGAETDEHQDHQFDGGKTCVECGYTKGSTIVILDPVDTEKPDLENPGTGAAVSGSSIGYACAALAAVGAIYVGAKKLAKKDEE